MSKTLEESTVLQSMPPATRIKQFTALLEGKIVTGQQGTPVPIPGLDEQYIEQQSAVEGQRFFVEGARAALATEKAAASPDKSIETQLAENLRMSITQLAMMENKLNSLGEQIMSIRRRIKELEEAGTK